MPAITKSGAFGRVQRHFHDGRSDASRLTTARDLAYLLTTGETYASIVTTVRAKDDGSTISTKTISLYVNALKDVGEHATPESFGAAYRVRHHASRGTTKPKAEPKPKADGVTQGNDATTPNVVEVKNAASAIAAFEALMRTVESLPARDRQRVVAHVTRVMARRYGKAA